MQDERPPLFIEADRSSAVGRADAELDDALEVDRHRTHATLALLNCAAWREPRSQRSTHFLWERGAVWPAVDYDALLQICEANGAGNEAVGRRKGSRWEHEFVHVLGQER